MQRYQQLAEKTLEAEVAVAVDHMMLMCVGHLGSNELNVTAGRARSLTEVLECQQPIGGTLTPCEGTSELNTHAQLSSLCVTLEWM